MPNASLPTQPALDQRVATGLHKLGLALRHQTWTLASEHGLSPTQGQILAALAVEGPLRASEVAARLGLGLPTVSEAVTTLAAKRLLRRTPDPHHPRARLLRLTADGARMAARTRAWPEFLTSAVAVLSESEQATMLTALMKMIRTLQEQGQIPTSRMCVTCVHFRPHVHTGATPHHCGFVDAPMAPSELRLDCGDHEIASPERQGATWTQFLGSA